MTSFRDGKAKSWRGSKKIRDSSGKYRDPRLISLPVPCDTSIHFPSQLLFFVDIFEICYLFVVFAFEQRVLLNLDRLLCSIWQSERVVQFPFEASASKNRIFVSEKI